MRDIVNFLMNPLLIFWVLLIAAWVINAYFKREKLARRCLFIALFWLFIISASPIPSWMMQGLEKRYTPFTYLPADLSKPVQILVLGAGHTLDPDLPSLLQLTGTALERISEGVRISRQIPGSTLVCSGYSKKRKTPTGEVMALSAISLGVSPSDTLVLPSPHNTKAESHAYIERFGEDYTLILVTSAAHMPRAMGHFRARGLDPIPAPCGYHVKKDPDTFRFPFKPSYGNIEMFQKAVHEWVGLLLVR